MTWLGLVALLLCLYLAFKLVGVVLKLALCALALILGYALVASHMGWPGPLEIVYVLGPDVDGLTPEGVALPDTAAVRERVADGIADAVAERIVPATEAEAAAGSADQAASDLPPCAADTPPDVACR